ncbi:membrane-associated protein, putative [Bodo saltans]|uniref:Membrane-associated protein, putative n=1 Tax=Bodo saltans TaxID=75058 RepID=A0A0S4IYN3_BODSA|nr:membrane-associated protein, putative [Bodo saltans]|eukprot:CUG11303.1 membrane-associated protein, putative [Bodo saltans]
MDNTALWLIVVGIATAAMGLTLMYAIWRGSTQDRSIRKVASEVERTAAEVAKLSGLTAAARGPSKVVEEDTLPHLPSKEQALASHSDLQHQLNDLLTRVRNLEHEVAALNASRSTNQKQEHATTNEEHLTSKSFEEIANDVSNSARLKSKVDRAQHRAVNSFEPAISQSRITAGTTIPHPLDAYIVMQQPEQRGFTDVPLAACAQFEPRRFSVVIDSGGDFRLRIENQGRVDMQSYLLRDFISLVITLDELPQQHVQCALFTFTWSRRENRQALMFCVPTTSPQLDEFVQFLDSTFETTLVKYPRAKALLL